MEVIFENEEVKVVFDEMLITAEMYCVANTAYNYFVDMTQNMKDNVSVTERIRSGEVTWLFECCSALFRFVDKEGKAKPYDIISHSEMKTLLMTLPHAFVKVLKSKVEFFFQLPDGLLSKPIMPSKQRSNAALVEQLALKMIEKQIATQNNSSQ